MTSDDGSDKTRNAAADGDMRPDNDEKGAARQDRPKPSGTLDRPNEGADRTAIDERGAKPVRGWEDLSKQ